MSARGRVAGAKNVRQAAEAFLADERSGGSATISGIAERFRLHPNTVRKAVKWMREEQAMVTFPTRSER